jgi:hypothetical protein
MSVSSVKVKRTLNAAKKTIGSDLKKDGEASIILTDKIVSEIDASSIIETFRGEFIKDYPRVQFLLVGSQLSVWAS